MSDMNEYERSLMGSSILPCNLRVHHATFHAGVKVSTAQASIDRLSDYAKELEKKRGEDKEHITKLEAEHDRLVGEVRRLKERPEAQGGDDA